MYKEITEIACYEAGRESMAEDIADILADFPEYRRYEPLKQIAELVGFTWEIKGKQNQ